MIVLKNQTTVKGQAAEQIIPLSVKAVGAALLPFQEPLKPKLVLPPGTIVPL